MSSAHPPVKMSVAARFAIKKSLIFAKLIIDYTLFRSTMRWYVSERATYESGSKFVKRLIEEICIMRDFFRAESAIFSVMKG